MMDKEVDREDCGHSFDRPNKIWKNWRVGCRVQKMEVVVVFMEKITERDTIHLLRDELLQRSVWSD